METMESLLSEAIVKVDSFRQLDEEVPESLVESRADQLYNANDTLRPEQAPGYPPESGFAGGPRTA